MLQSRRQPFQEELVQNTALLFELRFKREVVQRDPSYF